MVGVARFHFHNDQTKKFENPYYRVNYFYLLLLFFVIILFYVWVYQPVGLLHDAGKVHTMTPPISAGIVCQCPWLCNIVV